MQSLDRYTSSAYRAQRKAVFANIEAMDTKQKIERALVLLERANKILDEINDQLTGNGNPKN